MISIKNTQRKISIDVNRLKADAQTILDALDYSDFDLGIWLTTNATIRKYNKEYRHKDKATDVLSFPYHTALKAGQRIKVKEDDDKNLGDLILAPEYLLVHGICHLLGYDHIEDKDYKIMHKKEMELLKLLGHQ